MPVLLANADPNEHSGSSRRILASAPSVKVFRSRCIELATFVS